MTLDLDREQRYFLLHGLLGSLVSVRVEGFSNLPASGGAVLVCNHSDLFDSIIQGLYSGRRLTFMAGADVFQRNWQEKMRSLHQEFADQLPGSGEWVDHAERLLNVFSETLLDVTVLPILRNYRAGVARGSVSYYHEFLHRCRELLEQGHVIAVYPEGTRSRDGKLQPFKGFAARLALQARVPVVPAALSGIFGLSDIQRWASGKNRGRSVIYRIGEPIVPETFPEGTDKRAIKQLARRMEESVAELLQRGSARV